MTQELDLIKQWQIDQDPVKLSQIMISIAPLINSITHKWTGGGISNRDINIRAKALAVDALRDFDPNKSALSTHLNNRLQKISRAVYRNTGVITIPEHRAIQVGNYKRSISGLTDYFGREPNAQEIADDMNLPLREINRLSREVRTTLINNNLDEGEIFGEVVNYSPKIADAFNALQFDMTPNDKNIFQDITGYGRGITMKPGAVAEKYGLSGSQISRMKTGWARQMETFL